MWVSGPEQSEGANFLRIVTMATAKILNTIAASHTVTSNAAQDGIVKYKVGFPGGIRQCLLLFKDCSRFWQES